MTDRELLEQLFGFLKQRSFVIGDEASTRDMVQRYQRPPVTMLHRVAMQMTTQDYNNLGTLLNRIDDHLKETTPAEGEILESA